MARLRIELDGYSAPLTAGNFVTEVLSGALTNRRLDSSYTSVLAEDADGGQGEQLQGGPRRVSGKGVAEGHAYWGQRQGCG